MNMMKVFRISMTILAYIGMVFIVIGIYWMSETALVNITSSSYSFIDEESHEWSILPAILGWMFSIPGVVLALVAGIIARPRYFWIVLLVIGSFYCVIMITIIITPMLKTHEYDLVFLVLGSLSASLPGIACIIGALIIRWLRRKSEIALMNNSPLE
jgi:hypothetical protein